MTLLLVFGVTLILAVLVSGISQRTVLSTVVLFLLAGFFAALAGSISVNPESDTISTFAELALFSVLFTDGMRIAIKDLRRSWELPARALLVGMPLTLIATALMAHEIVGLPWLESLLLGTALSPTDPVFAAALVGREEVPLKVRRLLNIESGLNDGLALPVLVVLLALAGSGQVHLPLILGEVALGVLLGIVLPALAIWLERREILSPAGHYEPLYAFAIGVFVLGVTIVMQANAFLAAFTAGVMVATFAPHLHDAFNEFGELVTELLKLAAVLLFGALISPSFLGEIHWTGYLFAFITLVAVRPFALAVAMYGSGLTRREWITAAWFGPKGFASVVYALLILGSTAPDAELMYHLAAVVIAGSIIAHSSTDVLIAAWFDEGNEPERSNARAEEALG